MMSAERITLAFGDFELDLDPAALRRRGRAIKLQAQPLRLLALLASRGGELVTHREIHTHLWRDHVVDFAGGVHVCVRQVRNALDDDVGAPRFIETVPRHGYRFIARLNVVGTHDEARGAETLRSRRPIGRALTDARALAAALAVAAVAAASLALDDLWPGARAAAVELDGGGRANALYGQARDLWGYEQKDRNLLALDLLRRALHADPEHGPSHALLADMYAQHGAAYFGLAGTDDVALVERHLRLAADHGADASDILVTRGRLALYQHRNVDGALDHFERAIDSNPHNPWAWRLSAQALYVQGRFDDALVASREAEALSVDPNGVLWDRLIIYYLAERYQELFDLHARLEGTQRSGSITLGAAMVLVGRHEDAFDFIVDALRSRGVVIGDDGEARRAVRTGNSRRAYAWLLAEIHRNPDPPVGDKALAIFQLLAGDPSGAGARLTDYAKKFRLGQTGRHVDCLCGLTLHLDPFFRRHAGDAQIRGVLEEMRVAAYGVPGPRGMLSRPAI